MNSQVEKNQIAITDPTDAGETKRDPKAFTYDFAYDWMSTQEQVHLDLGAPIVEKALQGYNGEKTIDYITVAVQLTCVKGTKAGESHLRRVRRWI